MRNAKLGSLVAGAAMMAASFDNSYLPRHKQHEQKKHKSKMNKAKKKKLRIAKASKKRNRK